MSVFVKDADKMRNCTLYFDTDCEIAFCGKMDHMSMKTVCSEAPACRDANGCHFRGSVCKIPFSIVIYIYHDHPLSTATATA